MFDFDNILKDINDFEISNESDLEQFRLKFLSKKGLISTLFDDFKFLPAEQKRQYGKKLNDIKNVALNKFNYFKEYFSSSHKSNYNYLDLTLPSSVFNLGTLHPVTIVRNKICNIFSSIGFNISLGPEIEDDWHVFSGLNFPFNHPARDMQDTFFINKNPDILLRTHTSSIQIRVMENSNPPIRFIFPGRVFRNESISYRAHCIFHQIEGLYIDENVSFGDLKHTLMYFAKRMFGDSVKVRFRPSFFPFTEPSAEMDISCTICGGNGCSVCKYTGFLEILGCGMVHPNVLENCNIDNNKYTGFAFGMGVERITMLKFKINDLRLFFENDLRFLKQFSSFNDF